MEKIKTSVTAKFFAWLLITVSGLALVGSALLIFNLQEEGYYSRNIEEIREEAYARYSDRYSARALHYLGVEGSQSNTAYFEEKNFKYGIIQADSYGELERLDLNEPGTYEERNFTDTVSLEDVHIFQCSISNETYFDFRNPDSLWGYYWIRRTGNAWSEYGIERYVYDTASGIVYCEADNIYFPVPIVKLLLDGREELTLRYSSERNGYVRETDFDGDKENEGILEIALYGGDNDGYYYLADMVPGFTFLTLAEYGIEAGVWKYANLRLYQQGLTEDTGYSYSAKLQEVTVEETGDGAFYSVPVVIEEEMLSGGEAFIKDAEVSVLSENCLKARSMSDTSTSYFVLSFLPEELNRNTEGWAQGDLYEKFENVCVFLHRSRYQLVGVLFAGIGIFLCAFVFLCTCAGHRKGETGLSENLLNRIPLECCLAATVLLEIAAFYAIEMLLYYTRDFTDVFTIVMLILTVAAAGLLFTETAIELVSRIKMKTLFKRTILGFVCGKSWIFLKHLWQFAHTHIPLLLRAVIGFAVLFCGEFLLTIVIDGFARGAWALFLAEKLVLFLAFLLAVIWMQKLKEAGKHVAAGDLDYKVDTQGMLWDFKEHGEHLNSIGEGLSLAVEERMKSERFKTELITNVSHDIKTPLTSIINYVDLLQKGGVDEETEKAYLEVLERQSARLKKLLEDLLEASKASTGSLAVNFETLDAGVFLVQTVGEFEAKTEAERLELLIGKPDEPVYIRADGRHFWRVIDNLMNNVCKYAQPDTRVYINLQATEEKVFITFRNTSRYALNVSSEELMERFVRGDSSRNTEGSGLGLSIAQSLMELMHGTFELVVDGDLFKVILTFDRVH